MYLALKAASWVSASCLVGCSPSAHEFSLYLATLASRDSSEDIALFMHETALARGGRKEFPDRGKQSIVPISHDEIKLRCASCAQILQEAEPSLFALLGRRLQCQHLFVSF